MQTPPHDASPVRRLRLLIAFDGSCYHGWQSGRSGSGVADVMQRVLADALGVTDDLVSSSRTDSGVHAHGLVAHADVPLKHAERKADALRALLNAKLPADIRVREAAWVASSFHARFDASWKEYRYSIWNEPVMHPLRNGRAWHVPVPLDIHAMRKAASFLTGQHDFRAFTSHRKGELGATSRKLIKLSISRHGGDLTVRLVADGFLYKMCRGIVGTLVLVGRGKMAADDVRRLLENGTSRTPGVNAPAHGLVLWQVGYGKRRNF